MYSDKTLCSALKVDPLLDFPARLVDIDLFQTRFHEKARRSTREDLVVVITKNNLKKLRHTIVQYGNSSHRVVLIDDSTTDSTRKFVSSRLPGNVIYHGAKDQTKILKNLETVGTSIFVSPLGIHGRTLGSCRNYAVLLAALLDRKYLLMIDDDIIIEDIHLVDRSFELLRRYDIVGAHTSGMPDDSIVGHLARANGITQYDYITGQYCGVKIPAIHYPFPNVYNEDLILYALQGPGKTFARCGQVKHLDSDKFRNLGSRLRFQEQGELLLRGFAEAAPPERQRHLLTVSFWTRIMRERIVELKELSELIGDENSLLFHRVFRILRNYHHSLSAKALASFSRQYLSRVQAWRELSAIARKKSVTNEISSEL